MRDDSDRFEQEIGFGLWEVREGARLRREIRDVARFRAAVGEDLFVGLVQLLIAVNRLDGLLTAMDLTNRRVPSPGDGRPEHDPDSVTADRSRHVLVSMMWGTFHELIAATSRLQDARLTEVLTRSRDKDAVASWKTLRKAAHAWRDDLGTKARNQLAFHLGDAEVIKRGLDTWPPGTALIVSTSDHTSSRAGTAMHVGFDLLCRGLDLSEADWLALVDRGIKHVNLASDAMRVLFGVLHGKGAPIPSATVLGRIPPGPRRRGKRS